MNISNIRIGTRLALGFGLVVVLLLLMAVAGVIGEKGLAEEMRVVSEDRYPKIAAASAAAVSANRVAQAARNMQLMSDKAQIAAEAKAIGEARKAAGEAFDFLDKSVKSVAEGEHLKGIGETRRHYNDILDKFLAASGAGKNAEAKDILLGEMRPAQFKYFDELDDLIEFQKAMMDAASKAAAETASRDLVILIGLGIAGALFAFAVAFLVTRSITRPLSQAVAVADAMAAGDLGKKIDVTHTDETGKLLISMQTLQASVQALVADAAMLAAAAVDGKLHVRADASRHKGDFHRVVAGVNQALDAVIGPLNVAASYVDQISRGAIPPRITDSYNGEFNTLKNNLNVCIDAVNALVADASVLSCAAVEGKLETRADATRHQGDFRKIVEGVNATLDTVIGPLNEGMRVLGALARGDLTGKITGDYQGTFQKLKEDANTTVDRLAEIVLQLRDATESINVAAREIAAGNTDLSSRTEEQASSLEETASSMEELTSTVKQNAENAKQANQLAAGASDVAIKGGAVVGQVVATMRSINDSSKKIVDIISVIDGIAFQTNILALNAAVEAARAGEQGRGFAVVATEVRNLAQRSSAAAKEIKELIGDSVDKVGAGTKLVDEAGQTMAEIVSSVKRVTDIMAEITAASQEQSTGIEQVNQAIAQMDEVTQQNAALVEQAAAAAESMEEQAGNLAQAVAVFRLAGAAAGGASARSKPVGMTAGPANVAKLPSRDKPAAQAAARAKIASGGDWTEF